ncbi:hypothetical protein LNO10_17365 [Klebsiella variicola subsp. variicola]|nr:hypothetical protein [Klebsiella variicola subsp. variicola]
MLNDRTNLHYSRLADHLNNANLAMSDFVQRSAANFTVQGISPDAAQTAALKNLSALALREARTQAFSDAFYLIMMGFFACRAAGSLDEKAAGTLILQES